MMLVTCTLSPPSWLAMLPQKFSAATTWSLAPPPDDDPVELDDPAFDFASELQAAATHSSPTTSVAPSRLRQPDRLPPMRRLLSLRDRFPFSISKTVFESGSHYKSRGNDSQWFSGRVLWPR